MISGRVTAARRCVRWPADTYYLHAAVIFRALRRLGTNRAVRIRKCLLLGRASLAFTTRSPVLDRYLAELPGTAFVQRLQ